MSLSFVKSSEENNQVAVNDKTLKNAQIGLEFIIMKLTKEILVTSVIHNF